MQRNSFGLENFRSDIITASKAITFPKQFPKDEINSNFRKILVRDQKVVLYKDHKTTIYIMNVVCTLVNIQIE